MNLATARVIVVVNRFSRMTDAASRLDSAYKVLRHRIYRDYSVEDVHRLRFLQRARGLGFSDEECRELLSLYSDRERASSDVKAIVQEKLAEIDRKIEELTGLRSMLGHLVENCHGDARPECPIIDGLAGRLEH